MELSPAQLDEYLEVLREHGAEYFECPHFKVKLAPAAELPVEMSDADPDIARARERRAAAASAPGQGGLYGHKSLWGGGKPPAFFPDPPKDKSPYSDG